MRYEQSLRLRSDSTADYMNLHSKSPKLCEHAVQRFLGFIKDLKDKSATMRLEWFTHMKLGHLTPSWSPSIESAAEALRVLHLDLKPPLVLSSVGGGRGRPLWSSC